MSPSETLEDPGVIAYRVRMVEAAVLELRASQQSIATSLQQLVLLEQRHAETREALGRAFTTIGDNTKRIAAIEQELPTVRLVTRWVLGALIACAAAAATVVWRSATQTPAVPAQPRTHAAALEPARGLWITECHGSFCGGCGLRGPCRRGIPFLGAA